MCFLFHVGDTEVLVCQDMCIVQTGPPMHPANWTPA